MAIRETRLIIWSLRPSHNRPVTSVANNKPLSGRVCDADFNFKWWTKLSGRQQLAARKHISCTWVSTCACVSDCVNPARNVQWVIAPPAWHVQPCVITFHFPSLTLQSDRFTASGAGMQSKLLSVFFGFIFYFIFFYKFFRLHHPLQHFLTTACHLQQSITQNYKAHRCNASLLVVLHCTRLISINGSVFMCIALNHIYRRIRVLGQIVEKKEGWDLLQIKKHWFTGMMKSSSSCI